MLLKNRLFGPPWFWMIAALAIKAVGMLLLIQYSLIRLDPDEAQYWLWSRHLDWAYYSKPPGIAWLIRLGCTLFGNTELGVRFGALLVSTLLALGGYFFSRCCGLRPASAAWTAIVMAYTPLGIFSSLAATTDGGAILFWTFAAAYFCRALHEQRLPNYWMVAIFVLLSVLFKWIGFYFWVYVALFALLVPFVRSKQIWGGMILTLIGLLPTLIWNATHDWATFRHVYTQTVQAFVGGAVLKAKAASGNFWEFLAAQIALLSPVYFGLAAAALWHLWTKRRRDFSLLFPGAIFSTLLLFLVLACFNKIQGNWGVWIYPSAAVLLCWYTLEALRRPLWMIVGLVTSLALSSFLLAIPALQRAPDSRIPYAWNLFQRSMGWERLPKILTALGYDPQTQFLCSDTYQGASILSFYGPTQKRAYLLNFRGSRKNQFSYWPSIADEQQGKEALFCTFINRKNIAIETAHLAAEYPSQLKRYFKKVEFLGGFPLFEAQGQEVKAVLVFRCTQQLGAMPKDPDRY